MAEHARPDRDLIFQEREAELRAISMRVILTCDLHVNVAMGINGSVQEDRSIYITCKMRHFEVFFHSSELDT